MRQLTQQAWKSQIVDNAKYQENHVKTISVAIQQLKQLHTIMHSALEKARDHTNKTSSAIACVTIQTFVLHQYEKQAL